MAACYDEAYYGTDRKKFFSAAEAAVAFLTRRKWKRLEPLLAPGGPLLDIGCGRGTLLRVARSHGVEAFGVERPSPVGHALPDVFERPLRDCAFPDGHFQLVVLWHVLEHLPHPAETLGEVHRILRPGGWLSLAVPNFGGAQSRASGARWFHRDLPRHLWHFRGPALERLLQGKGFRVARRGTFSLEYDGFGTLQSWMNRAFRDDNGLYAVLQGESGFSVPTRLARLTAAAALALPALGSALWDAARGQGGTLTLTAQKPSAG